MESQPVERGPLHGRLEDPATEVVRAPHLALWGLEDQRRGTASAQPQLLLRELLCERREMNPPSASVLRRPDDAPVAALRHEHLARRQVDVAGKQREELALPEPRQGREGHEPALAAVARELLDFRPEQEAGRTLGVSRRTETGYGLVHSLAPCAGIDENGLQESQEDLRLT
jgi:hypothetical protein